MNLDFCLLLIPIINRSVHKVVPRHQIGIHLYEFRTKRIKASCSTGPIAPTDCNICMNVSSVFIQGLVAGHTLVVAHVRSKFSVSFLMSTLYSWSFGSDAIWRQAIAAASASDNEEESHNKDARTSREIIRLHIHIFRALDQVQNSRTRRPLATLFGANILKHGVIWYYVAVYYQN